MTERYRSQYIHCHGNKFHISFAAYIPEKNPVLFVKSSQTILSIIPTCNSKMDESDTNKGKRFPKRKGFNILKTYQSRFETLLMVPHFQYCHTVWTGFVISFSINQSCWSALQWPCIFPFLDYYRWCKRKQLSWWCSIGRLFIPKRNLSTIRYIKFLKTSFCVFKETW